MKFELEIEMDNKSSALNCNRGSELVAFLYGEAGEREAQDFEHHLTVCAECQVELNSFKQIRTSIIAWRDESLGSFSNAPSFAYDSGAVSVKRPSALAAIREFLNLSPLWLKGAVTFASIFFCITASLAVARLFDEPQIPVGSNSAQRYTEEDVAQRIRAAVELKEQQLRELEAQKQSETSTPIAQDNSRPQKRSNRLLLRATPESTNAQAVPLTKAERDQLAADLRLTTSGDELGPNLLSDRINQEQ